MRRPTGLIGVVGVALLLIAYAASAGPACSSFVPTHTADPQPRGPASDCGCGDQAGEAGADGSAPCSACATAALPTLDLMPRTAVWLAVIPLSLPSPMDVPSRPDRPPQA